METKPTIPEMAAVVTDIVKRFTMFTFNFPSGFIGMVWSDEPRMAEHLNNKFINISDNSFVSSGDFMRWFVELDGGNQSKLITWIDENYKG